METLTQCKWSFRDPSGFICQRNGEIFRQINQCYADDFKFVEATGLLQKLWDLKDLIPHQEEEIDNAFSLNAYKVLKPHRVPFISYPYEWSFSQLKDAALLTLDIQLEAMKNGLSLKDASAFNVQFLQGKPIFIDTLSFTKPKTNGPWTAYGQFCSHFLAPLALMCYRDIRLSKLLRTYIDGIPLDLATRLLPLTAKFHFGIFYHIFLHAKSQVRLAKTSVKDLKPTHQGGKISDIGQRGIIESLKRTVQSLKWKPKGTQWAEYYSFTNYTTRAFQQKEKIVSKLIKAARPKTVWDFGANDGKFSRIAAISGALTISLDIDPASVEKNYLQCKSNGETKILPLLMDWTNPSPGIGWSNEERMSIIERGPADMILALALIHHIAIGNNVPFEMVAQLFADLCKRLIIEWVPKEDSQVKKLLLNREDIFKNYNEQDFLSAFSRYFIIESKIPLEESTRIIFFMRSKVYSNTSTEDCSLLLADGSQEKQ